MSLTPDDLQDSLEQVEALRNKLMHLVCEGRYSMLIASMAAAQLCALTHTLCRMPLEKALDGVTAAYNDLEGTWVEKLGKVIQEIKEIMEES